MASIEKGKIIGEFDLYDYGLPTTNGYLFHQVSNGGNSGQNYPENREYLRIIGFDSNNQLIEYGYVYFMLYIDKDGMPVSKYIGLKVFEEYRKKGLGDLLMSAYLYYSYDRGFTFAESTTRQRKLDILSLMNKYGYRVKQSEKYDNGERITLFKNNMVVDIYKQNKGGIYYRFKTGKAENIYKRNNAKIAGGYNYLAPPKDMQDPSEMNSFKKLGWVVPNEDYVMANGSDQIIEDNLKKSHFSR